MGGGVATKGDAAAGILINGLGTSSAKLAIRETGNFISHTKVTVTVIIPYLVSYRDSHTKLSRRVIKTVITSYLVELSRQS